MSSEKFFIFFDRSFLQNVRWRSEQNWIDYKKTVLKRLRVFLEFARCVYCSAREGTPHGKKKDGDNNIFCALYGLAWVGLGWVGSARLGSPLPSPPLPRLNAKFNFNQEASINERLKRKTDCRELFMSDGRAVRSFFIF